MNFMDDYKSRIVKEYTDLKEKHGKLRKIIIAYDNKTLSFKLNCPIEVLKKQEIIMREYLRVLEQRAEIENIVL